MNDDLWLNHSSEPEAAPAPAVSSTEASTTSEIPSTEPAAVAAEQSVPPVEPAAPAAEGGTYVPGTTAPQYARYQAPSTNGQPVPPPPPPPYGRPPYDRPPAPPYGQPPYGQPPVPPAGPYGQPPYGQPPMPPKPRKRGLSIAAMVLGIVSVALFFCWPIALICAMVGLVLAIVALVKHQSLGFSITGLITSIFGILIGALLTVAVIMSVREAGNLINSWSDDELDEFSSYFENSDDYEEYFNSYFENYFSQYAGGSTTNEASIELPGK